jgi:DNA-binding transcriptional ArsR family regulator
MSQRRTHDHHPVTDRGRPAARSGSPAVDAPAAALVVALKARGLAHPTRVGVLRELDALGVASPRLLADRLNQPLGAVSYHVRTLRALALIEVIRTVQRRGALEHYYRLAAAALPLVEIIDALSGEPSLDS